MESHRLINQDSGNTEWWTPKPIIAVAKDLMGGIDFDPACSGAAFAYHQHCKIYCDHAGLERAWPGNVWMNHPFGRGQNEQWVSKLIASYEEDTTKQACCITFASVSERWFQPLLRYPQFFFCGRINYIDPVTLAPVKGVTKGSVLTWLYPKWKDYRTALNRFSSVMLDAGFKGIAK